MFISKHKRDFLFLLFAYLEYFIIVTMLFVISTSFIPPLTLLDYQFLYHTHTHSYTPTQFTSVQLCVFSALQRFAFRINFFSKSFIKTAKCEKIFRHINAKHTRINPGPIQFKHILHSIKMYTIEQRCSSSKQPPPPPPPI